MLLLAALASLAATPAGAQDFRAIRPIARPAALPPLPDGAVRVAPPRPVARATVEAAMAKVAAAWTDKRLDGTLAADFYRRDELRDAMQTRVPRDARLRVVAVQGWQVLDQYRRAGTLYTRLSVTARTQVEFNDPAAGFQARDGTNDYEMTLSEREAP